VIYIDSSVVLAELLSEDRSPPESFWQEQLSSSRLLEYEVWNRIHARGQGSSHGAAARQLLDRITLLELTQPILARALEPFPLPIRTLDALHLATIEFLRSYGQEVGIASYDRRLNEAGHALGIPIYDI
jgi:predicted nucleic acid-binding protein